VVGRVVPLRSGFGNATKEQAHLLVVNMPSEEELADVRKEVKKGEKAHWNLFALHQASTRRSSI
jgi:hypothetical protein